MGKIGRFEKIEAWQKARFLVKKVYLVCRIESYRKVLLAGQIKNLSIS